MNRDLSIEIDGLRVVSEANLREHYMAKHKRKKEQQRTVHYLLAAADGMGATKGATGPAKVTLTRIGPKRLDKDNLAGCFKHVQDAVAAYLGIDDGDERIEWRYRQEPVGQRRYAVRIEIERRTA